MHRMTIVAGIGGVLASVLAFIFIAFPAEALPANFQDTTLWSGLNVPTAITIAPNGKVYLAEKNGVIKVFDSISDPSATVFADLRPKVQDFTDRGLLGIVVDPQFPTRPYVYALYTMDAPIGGTPPVYNDNCPNPNNCLVGSRLVKLTASANGNSLISEQTLYEGWCQIEDSHSVGALRFGADGALYVSHGDGASYNYVDFGQDGGCIDPPNEGGALRSQDLRTAGDPLSYDGSILRVDPDTGAAFPGNPLIGGTDTEDDRVIAHGLRNPFRFSVDPQTGVVWVGDVGWNEWEEVNRIASVTDSVDNFGWPCYEGVDRQSGYDSANLPICESLYTAGTSISPMYQYPHSGGSGAISAVALYRGNNFPAAYNGALFFADYTKQWIRVMMPDAQGNPNPSNIVDFVPTGNFTVDLIVGPDGALYYVDIFNGSVHRVSYFLANVPPVADVAADVTTGPVPLTVNFTAAGSSDPNPGDTLSYAWDLDGDTQFDDSTAIAPSFVYATSGPVTVTVRVTDSQNASSTDSIVITPGNQAPTATILTPTSTHQFFVGEVIAFSGEATDPDTGPLPASALTWVLVLQHCALNNPNDCHEHTVQTINNVASGTFVAPDHEYPSRLELRLIARDSSNPSITDTESVLMEPQTSTMSFQSDPSGLQITVYATPGTTPFTRTVIVGAQTTISATTPQTLGGTNYSFSSWSDGGAQTHTVTATAAPQTFTATYGISAGPVVWNSWDVVTQSGSPQGRVTSSSGFSADLEFYESDNNFGIVKSVLLPLFATTHADSFNNLENFWSNASGGNAYPYVGKSTVNRGSDAGEANTPAPLGVRDLAVHPPVNDHNTVVAFKVPQNGTYVISNLGVRRVSNSGNDVRFRLFNPAGTQLTTLNATNNQDWVTTATTYDLGSLSAGQYIYFTVDRNGVYDWDAAEMAWTITLQPSGPAAPSCSLSVNPTSIVQGGTSALSWTTSNATSLSINQGVGSVTPVASGSTNVSPTVTTTYTGTVTGPGGTTNCTTTLTVTAPSAPTLNLNATPASIIEGQSSTLSWTSANATSCTASGAWSGTKSLTGSESVSPLTTSTYTLQCSGPGGSITQNVTVTVTPPPPPPTCSLNVTPGTIEQGGTASLGWTTTNATSLSIDQGIGSVTPVASGSRSITPTATTTYTGTATGPSGSVQCSATINVTPSTQLVWNSWNVVTQAGSPQGRVTSVFGSVAADMEFYESTNNFGVTKSALFSTFNAGTHPTAGIFLGQYWANATGNAQPHAGKSTVGRGSGTGEGNTPNPTGVMDLQLFPPNNDHNVVAAFKVPQNGTYVISNIGVRRVSSTSNNARLRVFNAAGTELTVLNATSNQDWVTTATTYNLGNLSAGQYIYFGVDRNGTTNSSDATEIAWTITATPSAPPPPPTLNLNASPTTIQSGSSATLTWSSTDATSCTASGAWSGTKALSGSESVSPTATSTYSMTCTGQSGNASQSVTVNVTPPPPGGTLVWNSWNTTTQAGSPQGRVTSVSGGVLADLEFYESTNNFGITKSALLSTFVAGMHADSFNNVQTFWYTTGPDGAYPYVGKSTVGRGSDAGEAGALAPLGVNDLAIHPPVNDHNTVVAFKVPQNGTYVISNLGVRRVSNSGNNVRLRVFNPAGTQLTTLNATNNQDWVTTATTYNLGALTAGQYIYFGVDRNGVYDWDAAEISWTVTKN